MKPSQPTNPEGYIDSYPESTQDLLRKLRATIKKAAPQATEVLSYGMPAYKLNGMLVWFGPHTRHIGFYPRALGIAAFKKELSGYKSSKGAVQFPMDEPLPLSLVTEIIKFRVKENLEKSIK